MEGSVASAVTLPIPPLVSVSDPGVCSFIKNSTLSVTTTVAASSIVAATSKGKTVEGLPLLDHDLVTYNVEATRDPVDIDHDHSCSVYLP